MATSWEAIGTYFDALKFTWKFEDRLELFSQSDLYKVSDSQEIGFFMVWVKDCKFFIADIHVYESCRNQGYGAKMLVEIAKIAKSKGHERVWLRVFKNNPAVRLYERAGFEFELVEKTAFLMSAHVDEIKSE